MKISLSKIRFKSILIYFFSDTGKENFIVMLFNDESHTYEEVIETLQSAVPDCQKNHAVHFATIVDKMVNSCFLSTNLWKNLI